MHRAEHLDPGWFYKGDQGPHPGVRGGAELVEYPKRKAEGPLRSSSCDDGWRIAGDPWATLEGHGAPKLIGPQAADIRKSERFLLSLWPVPAESGVLNPNVERLGTGPRRISDLTRSASGLHAVPLTNLGVRSWPRA